jgi:hypothetical protein
VHHGDVRRRAAEGGEAQPEKEDSNFGEWVGQVLFQFEVLFTHFGCAGREAVDGIFE